DAPATRQVDPDGAQGICVSSGDDCAGIANAPAKRQVDSFAAERVRTSSPASDRAGITDAADTYQDDSAASRTTVPDAGATSDPGCRAAVDNRAAALQQNPGGGRCRRRDPSEIGYRVAAIGAADEAGAVDRAQRADCHREIGAGQRIA